jgi:hypothetical protein
MKTVKRGTGAVRPLLIFLFLACFAGMSAASDVESYYVIDRLLSMTGPGVPEIIDDAVIFTYTSNCRRAGVAFAHEGFSRVHWFRQLLITQDPLTALIPTGKKIPDPYKDSGILFYVHQIPENVPELEYRLIIDGLWTADPVNPASRKNAATGIEYSVLTLPVRQNKPEIVRDQSGTLNFSFKGPPGETITVAGSFNGWDPFMYELKEGSAGNYSLSLSMPPGTYQYVFFRHGRRYLDPNNPNRIYSREGIPVSEVILQ